jgi:hypothetical protein
MASRQIYYAESTAESSDASGAYVDKVTLTFTPDASATYYIIASWLMQQLTSTIRYVAGKLIDSTGAATYNEFLHDTADVTEDYYSCGALGIFTAGASPVSNDFKIQYKGENNAVTAKIKQARIIAIKSNASDQSAASTGQSTTTSSTYQDKTTLTFTPASTGDYIILAAAEVLVGTAAKVVDVQLDIDGTKYNTALINIIDNATDAYMWAAVRRINLSNASHTIKIQYASDDNATTVKIQNARIIALRADTFDNNYYDEDTTRQTTASTSMTDTTVSITQTPQAVNHVLIAAGVLDSSSATQDMYAQLVEGGVVQLGPHAEEVRATTNVYPFFFMYSKSLAASSTNFKLQFRAETSNTVGLDDGALSIIQLDATPAGVIPNKVIQLNQAVNRASTY